MGVKLYDFSFENFIISCFGESKKNMKIFKKTLRSAVTGVRSMGSAQGMRPMSGAHQPVFYDLVNL